MGPVWTQGRGRRDEVSSLPQLLAYTTNTAVLMSIIVPTQLDPRLFALARPGGPLSSQSQLLGSNSSRQYSHIPKAHASPAVTAFLVFKIKKQRSLRPKLHPRLNHHQRRMLTVAVVVANGHSASLHNGLEVGISSSMIFFHPAILMFRIRRYFCIQQAEDTHIA